MIKIELDNVDKQDQAAKISRYNISTKQHLVNFTTDFDITDCLLVQYIMNPCCAHGVRANSLNDTQSAWIPLPRAGHSHHDTPVHPW